ncbi:Uma2 family endonuclease [Psychrobacter sp. I-STPA6b]|uniref:Uma2 family endonuclease n=1 Tax=Psychrobacter sp. I-STPA6b TaxID=2585718 RepID=UPI001D0C1C56|nr:Uma2 family endonuclease [Psychrobacter sp. I-STPA6b]
MGNITKEQINGVVHHTTDTSKRHQQLISNLHWRLAEHLYKTDSPYQSLTGMMINLNEDIFCPDLVITRLNKNSNQNLAYAPTIIIEVLSSNTRDMDIVIKRDKYQDIASLTAYILVEQDSKQITVFQKKKYWDSRTYQEEEEIYLDSINYKIAVDDIYHRVRFPVINHEVAQSSPVNHAISHIIKGAILTVALIIIIYLVRMFIY